VRIGFGNQKGSEGDGVGAREAPSSVLEVKEGAWKKSCLPWGLQVSRKWAGGERVCGMENGTPERVDKV
jgi:hypothetical protein